MSQSLRADLQAVGKPNHPAGYELRVPPAAGDRIPCLIQRAGGWRHLEPASFDWSCGDFSLAYLLVLTERILSLDAWIKKLFELIPLIISDNLMKSCAICQGQGDGGLVQSTKGRQR